MSFNNKNNEEIHGREEILKIVTEYYQQLYTKTPNYNNEDLKLDHKRIK